MTHAMFRAAAATYLLLALPSLSQAQSLPGDALLTKGMINFAADFAAAPNQFLNADGTRDGLNVDICGKIAEKMGLKIEWTNLAFPGLVPGLQAKRFDALCTAIFINPQRLEIMNMVPYVQWGEGLMVPNPVASVRVAPSRAPMRLATTVASMSWPARPCRSRPPARPTRTLAEESGRLDGGGQGRNQHARLRHECRRHSGASFRGRPTPHT